LQRCTISVTENYFFLSYHFAKKKKKQVTLFTNDGKLKNPASYGDWTTTCGTTYVHRLAPVVRAFAVVYNLMNLSHQSNQADAINLCCKIGMSLIEFSDAAEVKCIGDWNNGK
jgi:NADH:ubiquinone oxidoreductase subunit C